MQQSVLTLPPLSVLLKEGLKGALQGDISVNITSTTSSYSPILKTAPEAMNEPCEFPIQIKSDGNYGGRQGKDITDVTLFPRRKAGENHQEGGRGPVVLSVELLQSFYGMPLHVAAKKLVSAFLFIFQIYILHLSHFVLGNLPDSHQESMQVMVRLFKSFQTVRNTLALQIVLLE